MTVLNCKNLIKDISLVMARVLLILLAFFIFSSYQAFSAENEQNIVPAMEELSQVYGQPITSKDQAHEVCNQEKFLTACTEIGKKYSLYNQEEVKQVDAFLNEIKGTIAQNLQNCQTVECLVGVANDFAKKVSVTNPTLAKDFNLTAKIVQEKQTIVQAAKDYGISFDQCRNMDPDSASVELLRACAKLARDSRVQQFVPDQVKQAAEFSDKAVELRESLTKGEYKCGDGTLNSCGDFCLNPSAATKAAGIPQVCRDIAKKFFGADGEKQLELSYQQVKQVRDFYDKKVQNVVFTTLDGKTLTKPEDIGRYMEQEGKKGNVEAIEKGMDFMITQGFIKPAEKEFALKFVRQIKDRGGIPDFDACVKNPLACRDFLPEEDRQSFDVNSQIEQIMTQEIGFKPAECERGSVDKTIGQRCYEGSKRALSQLEALAVKNPQARFIVEDIKGHLTRGEQQISRKDEFRQVFQQQGGPGGCKSEDECYSYCSDPTHGPECIAFGAKQNISGFRGQEAVQKFQEFNQTLQAPEQFQSTSVFPRPDQFPGGQFPGQGPYPGFQPPGFGGYLPPGQIPGFTQPGPGFGQTGPSPECFAAIQSGDFVRAKAVCAVSIPTGLPPLPSITPIGPPVTIPVCPPGNYWDGRQCVSSNTFDPEVQCRNAGGVFDQATRSCRIGGYSPSPTYSPGATYSPYPTYSPPPAGGWEGQYPGQCSDGVDNDGDNLIDSADPSCTTPITSSGSCPSGSHIMYVNNAGGYCMLDSDTSKCGPLNSSSVSGFGSCTTYQTTYPTYSPPPSGTYTPYPTYSPGPGSTSCSQSLINLLGTGCHQMYTDSSGRTIYCDGPMTKSAKEGDTVTTSGCSGAGGPTYSPYPTSSPYPGGTYTPYPICPSGQWWDSATSTCKLSTATYTPAPSCPAGQWWDYQKNSCTSTTSCGYGYYWDSANSVCKPSSTTYTPAPSCPSGQWWDYGTSSCRSSTATYTPYPTCPSGQYWSGSSCVSSGTTYTPYPTYSPAYTYSPPPYSPPTSETYTPPPYSPPPTYSPPPESSPPPSSYIHHQIAIANTIMACADSGGNWQTDRCVTYQAKASVFKKAGAFIGNAFKKLFQ